MITGSKPNGNLLVFHISALLVMCIWGGSFVWSRVLIKDLGLSPVEVYMYRFAIAYLLIWPFTGGRLFSRTLTDEILLALCGLCGSSLYFLAENNAVALTTPSNVSLITTLSPLLTTLLIGLIYKNERPGMWIWVGSILSFMGVALIVFKNGFEFEIGSLGDLLALLAALSWAFYSLILRKVDANYSAIFITRKTFFYGLVTALPFLLSEPETTPLSVLLSWDCIFNILLLALGASVFGYFVWSLAVQKLGPVKASNYLYVQPIATMFISAVYFADDPITLVGCVGCALIIGGIWLGDTMTRRKKL